MSFGLGIIYFPFFFFYDKATTEIYTLSLHDALPISRTARSMVPFSSRIGAPLVLSNTSRPSGDRKSTRLNSSHVSMSYAGFCLKKKKMWFTGCGLWMNDDGRASCIDGGACP